MLGCLGQGKGVRVDGKGGVGSGMATAMQHRGFQQPVTANLYNLLRTCSVEWRQPRRAKVENVISSRFVSIVYPWTPQCCELETQKFDLTIGYSLVRPEQTFDQFLSPPAGAFPPHCLPLLQ